MIIGLAGKKGCGKNTVSDMLIYLLNSNEDINNKTYTNYTFYFETNFNPKWTTHSFAGNIKKIMSILFNINEKLLNDEDFKLYNYINLYDLKIYNESDIDEKYIGSINFSTLYDYSAPYYINIRTFLQEYSTEIMRRIMGDKLWVLSLLNKYDSKKDNWIIEDVRMPNTEAKYISELGGKILKIERKKNILSWLKSIEFCAKFINIDKYKMYSIDETLSLLLENEASFIKLLTEKQLKLYKEWKKQLLHSSESQINDINYDYIIYNDSDLETLFNNVKMFCIKNNLI